MRSPQREKPPHAITVSDPRCPGEDATSGLEDDQPLGWEDCLRA